MIYFSGFSLANEEELFSSYYSDNNNTVVGFSYGGQRAFEYLYHSKIRIDRLILISPAFFQSKKPSYIRTQLRYFETNQEAYINQFLSNSIYPSNEDISPFLSNGTKEQLRELLEYKWDREKLQEVVDRGVTIEVFLGQEDKIINSQEVLEFFTPYATIYQIKGVGHILR
ncbi:MAG: pimelyl-ACP methyl ester esterase BioV [Sulfurovum sp.]